MSDYDYRTVKLTKLLESFWRSDFIRMLTNTNLYICLASKCKYNRSKVKNNPELICRLQHIEIGDNGICAYFSEGEFEVDYKLKL